MSTLRIYDTKGNAYSPDGTATGTNEQIKDLFYGGVRLAIRSDHRQELSLFFRARETRNARTEQFYAVYSVDNSTAPLRDLIDDLTTRIESEWGYTIDDSSDEMKVYRELKRGNTALPGDSQEQDVLSELVASRSSVTVGVSDERNAIGLLSEYLGEFDQAAIADSTDADVLSTFDLVVTPGGHRGITPLAETEARWESTAGSLRDKHIKQEITSIRESVETLSREHGLSNDEIRSRVQSSVPALKTPVTGANLGSTASGSDDDYLVPPKVGLYIAVGAVVLIVLFAAMTVGPQLLGSLGVVDGGGGQTPSQANVAGALVDNTTNEQISTSTGNISIELRNETGVTLEEATQPRYNFTVSETRLSNLTLAVAADGYQNRTVTLSPESRGGNISLTPAASEGDSSTRSRVEGGVRDATADAYVSVTVSLTGDERFETTTGDFGSYSFDDVPAGEYNLSVNADGYVPESRTVDVNGMTTQVDTIGLEQTASLSVYFNASDTAGGVSGADVYLRNNATGNAIPPANPAETNEDGWYNTTGLEAGVYDIEFRGGEYENINENGITLEPGQARIVRVTVTRQE
ncbi:carboxypeptidase-like regulatory domain-containing protein [Halorubrum ejinorense]|uniref:Carboxypeptidase-like regulatory domain-containing protein n=1 Tax=Halorubrum ejinorense TaxID=425309 RepID=A0AAV3SUK7_9EURY